MPLDLLGGGGGGGGGGSGSGLRGTPAGFFGTMRPRLDTGSLHFFLLSMPTHGSALPSCLNVPFLFCTEPNVGTFINIINCLYVLFINCVVPFGMFYQQLTQ